MTYQNKTALLFLCAASLTLTACGSRLHNNHAQTSGVCGAYVQSCAPTRYGHIGYNSGAYDNTQYHTAYTEPYQSPYVQAYPTLQPTYVPTQQSVVSYVPIAAAPEPIPIPVYEPAPIVEYTPEPPLSSWNPEPWSAPWRDESDCPEGTIQGYGGSDCVQVAIPRK